MFHISAQPGNHNINNNNINNNMNSSYGVSPTSSSYLSLGGGGNPNNNNNGGGSSSSSSVSTAGAYQQPQYGGGVSSFLLSGGGGTVASTKSMYMSNINNNNNGSASMLLSPDGSILNNNNNTAMMMANSGLPNNNNNNNILMNGSNGASSSNSTGGALVYPHWRSLIDNMAVEFMASLFTSLATVMFWTTSVTNTLQFMPSVVMGLVLVCIKDEDYFFPDTSPTITFVLWVLGGYTWIHALARMIGQVAGFGIALWILLYADTPILVYRVPNPLNVAFAFELIGTTLEHLAIVYVILPLLPPAHHHHHTHHHSSSTAAVDSLRFVFPKVKPKSHHETQAPSNPVVLHAAIVLGTLHWCLSRGMCIEMSPLQTLLITILRWQNKGGGLLATESNSTDYHHHGEKYHHVWEEFTISLWAQMLGLLICICYVMLFAPRETKYWPAILKLKN